MSVSQISLRTSRCTNCCRALAQKFVEIGAKIGRLFCHSQPSEPAASGRDLSDRSLVPQSAQPICANAEISVEESLSLGEDNDLLSTDATNPRINPQPFDAGLVYTIYNPSTDTYSYLIGTCHDPLYGRIAEGA